MPCGSPSTKVKGSTQARKRPFKSSFSSLLFDPFNVICKMHPQSLMHPIFLVLNRTPVIQVKGDGREGLLKNHTFFDGAC